jgi:hypothetical protein
MQLVTNGLQAALLIRRSHRSIGLRWPQINPPKKGTVFDMITVPFSLTPYLVDATAHRQGYTQVIMPMHVSR